MKSLRPSQTLWTRMIAALLLVQQLVGPVRAQAQLEMNANELVSHLRQVNFGSGLHDVEKLFDFFEASPSLELGRDLVLRGAIELNKEFYRNHRRSPLPTPEQQGSQAIINAF